MAKKTTGVAQFTKEIDTWFNTIGLEIVRFDSKTNPVQETINDFIAQLRHNLERDKHIATGNLYQQLGEGWEFETMGMTAKISLVLPDYYSATDTGRDSTSGGGTGQVRKNLQGLRGWISQKKLVPSGGMTFKSKRKLKDGTVKTYTTHLSAKKANMALAFLISRKIHRFGFRGTGWFSSEVKTFVEMMNVAIEEQFGQGMTFNIIINGNNS